MRLRRGRTFDEVTMTTTPNYGNTETDSYARSCSYTAARNHRAAPSAAVALDDWGAQAASLSFSAACRKALRSSQPPGASSSPLELSSVDCRRLQVRHGESVLWLTGSLRFPDTHLLFLAIPAHGVKTGATKHVPRKKLVSIRVYSWLIEAL